MAREFSAGGVVLRRFRGKWQLAAIEPRRDAANASQPRVLALPKGIVDPGERPQQTALREVREETGLDAELVGKLGDVKYVYRRTWGDGQRVFKIVTFYLFLYRDGKLGNISDEMRHEVAAAEWIPLDDASRLLSYRGERDMAKNAIEYVRAHPELR
ncbi:MAG TPA: NUDIX domain-containing protein [Terriglobales bacterium]|jgi:8-oxo-dGTP pyrophosphatase MutT (NUDIX family)|nr:NUDIX domain-containing protein [Terriglobales bacterium]